MGSRRSADRPADDMAGAATEGPGPAHRPGLGSGSVGDRHPWDDAIPGVIPDPPSPTRRKAKQVADAARRARHRLAEERLEAERAQRRADNRAAREREAAARAEQQRTADAARARAQEDERLRQAAAAAATRERPAPASADDEAAQAAERERKRRAAAERQAARAERNRRRAEQQTARHRAKESARRAEREAVRARARGADPYATLGVAPDTTAEDVTRAYRRLARALHPDLHRQGTPQERAAREAQMKRVNVAYGILGDAQRRSAYDRLRRGSAK